ncbi:hypothetical protein Lalb_Chr20g0112821 [Lupinus albus]|uniref:Uncharacterized protein n=1 Tax=Lupinus albus TaxID=3870 RepID=A0A6A4NN67_LUPAL|nr:hypothetical protein Lalb_Chr20g0112821 [Lupinus albus]
MKLHLSLIMKKDKHVFIYSVEPLINIELLKLKICLSHSHTKTMADKYFLCIAEEMDRLWFHQFIIFSEPTPSVAPKPIRKHVPTLESLSSNSSPTSILSFTSLLSEETSIDESHSSHDQFLLMLTSLPLQNDSIDNKEEMKERMGRMNVLSNRIHSHSLSPSTQHTHIEFKNPTTARRKLDHPMSCKTLKELELDEVKGFMDLGFIFKKENLSPKLMSIVPGLQRLGLDNDIEANEEEKRDIKRPYLSEAWNIRILDSPLLSLRIHKPYSAANMKKHIQVWAKIVAYKIYQE